MPDLQVFIRDIKNLLIKYNKKKNENKKNNPERRTKEYRESDSRSVHTIRTDAAPFSHLSYHKICMCYTSIIRTDAAPFSHCARPCYHS